MNRRLLISLVTGALLLALVPPIVMFMAITGGTQDSGTACAPGGTSLALASGEALNDPQSRNAATVVAVGRRMGIPDRGIIVALAVARQESGFRNYANDGAGTDLDPSQRGIESSLSLPHEAVGSDHGSLGIFQQQWPWWGSMQELMSPAHAAEKFFRSLLKVPGWEQMSVTEAGQTVQRSAFPDAYADDEVVATALLTRFGGDGNAVAMSDGSCLTDVTEASSVAFPLPASASYVDQRNFGRSGALWSAMHTGTDLSTACGTPVLAATAGTVVVRTDQPWSGRWLVQVSTGPGQLATWYAHMESLTVANGQQVQSGQQLGTVGNEGNSSGCHLHFEVHPEGGGIYDDPVDPSTWIRMNSGSTQPVVSTEMTGRTVSLMTANIKFNLPRRRWSAHLRWLLSADPDVLMVQEAGHADIGRALRGVPGSWTVWQPPGRGQSEAAIIWDSSKFAAVERGATFAVRTHKYERWMTWAILESADGVHLPVVSMHMPSNAAVSSQWRRNYLTMTRRYQQLLRSFVVAGHSPIVAADWNGSMQGGRQPWRPVPVLNRNGFTTNWQEGTPCVRTRQGGGKIDGFAYQASAYKVMAQRCLPFGYSDHRPVWIAVGPVVQDAG